MSSEIVILHTDESLSIADRIMNLGRIRHMPVTDRTGKLCGVISQRDLLFNALGDVLGTAPEDRIQALHDIVLADCMTPSPVTTTPDTPLKEAAQLMLKYKYGCLPVIDDGTVVGMITEADFVAAFAD